MQRYDEAKLAMNAIQNPAAMMMIWMAAVYAQAGNISEASELAAKFVAVVEQKLGAIGVALPQSWLGFVDERWPFKHSEDREHFLGGLRKAGLTE